MSRKILIVDDSPVARRILFSILPSDDTLILEAANGREGVACYEEHRPDIVFMDLTMPVMDGFEAIEKIHALDPEAVIFAVTADVQPKSVAKARQLGALDVLRKPPSVETIVGLLGKAYKQRDTQKAARRLPPDGLLSTDEIETLKEIMNIAFGNATADLAEVIDVHVKLSLPDVKLVDGGALPNEIVRAVDAYQDTSLVNQSFWGDFKGNSLLVFPRRAAPKILQLIQPEDTPFLTDAASTALERETLLEIGNILIGACVGKIASLLHTIVTYSPPLVMHRDPEAYQAYMQSVPPGQKAILMETVFSIDENDIHGMLMILTDALSINWLRKALTDFLEGFL